MQRQKIDYYGRVTRELKNFPPEISKEVLDFIEFLKIKIQTAKHRKKKATKVEFKTCNLGKMKKIDRKDIYGEYLSVRF
ncbi:MAG: DUF2281 domain-containing protein [bacterium]